MSTQKNEHNPDNLTPKQVGKGFRLLQYGEVIDPMDEMYITRFGNSCWEPTGPNAPGHIIEKAHYAHRRRITPPTDTTGSGREGETAETNELLRQLRDGSELENWCANDVSAFLKHARQLERQRDAALAQVEALRRTAKEFEKQVARRLWTSDDGVNIRDSDPSDYIDDDPALATAWSLFRAAIDSAQRQEG